MNKEKIIDKNKNYIRLLEFALNNIPEAVYINDNDGTILFVNKRNKNIFDELLSKSFMEKK